MTIQEIETIWAPRMLSMLRIVSGLIFWQHGIQKLLLFPAAGQRPPAFSQFWFAGIVELTLPPLLIIGLLTRPVAFLLAGEMAIAYWFVHVPRSFYPSVNGG